MSSSPPAFTRRSNSLPVVRQTSTASPDEIKVLLDLPSARVISFTTTEAPSASKSDESFLQEAQPGTLKPSSRFERTLGIGPLRIYRAPSSVAFLNCQNALRPILPKSQCWCINDESTQFVLQIRRPTYWRIEIPGDDANSKLQSEELRKVLADVLLFEKTPCPFERSFTVELPSGPQTPVAKKPWRPVERRDSRLPFPELGHIWDSDPSRRESRSIHRGPLSDRSSSTSAYSESIYEASDVQRTSSPQTPTPTRARSNSHVISPLSSNRYFFSPDSPHSSGLFANPAYLSEGHVRSLASSLEAMKALGSQHDRYYDVWESDIHRLNFPDESLGLSYDISTPLPQKRTRPTSSELVNKQFDNFFFSSTNNPDLIAENTAESLVVEQTPKGSAAPGYFDSAKSQHLPSSSPSSAPPGIYSPENTHPSPHNNVNLFGRSSHNYDVSEGSESTVASEPTSNEWDTDSTPNTKPSPITPPESPATLAEKDESSDIIDSIVLTPTRQPLRHRATTSIHGGRRALSPLPSAANIFSPSRSRPRHLQTAHHLPTAIIQKTWEIFLFPTSQLFKLMISIATKIAAGIWRGVFLNRGGAIHWNFEDDNGGQLWTEDDYGTRIGRRRTSDTRANSTAMTAGWEVD